MTIIMIIITLTIIIGIIIIIMMITAMELYLYDKACSRVIFSVQRVSWKSLVLGFLKQFQV